MNILVVDDNRSSADLLAKALTKRGDQVRACYDGETAISHIRSEPPDLVLTDWHMEPVSGLEVLQAAREQRPPVEVIVFTGYGTLDTAVGAMRLGARDYLTKPVNLAQVKARLEELERSTQNSSATNAGADDTEFVAVADVTRTLLADIERAAKAPSHVWIEGEIGSGRGFVASTLHKLSSACDTPLQTVDLFRLAEHPLPSSGTVLLPNLDDLPEDLLHDVYQAVRNASRGLRIIVTASGDDRSTRSRTWQELYYALSVIVLRVPPLRVRRADILPLFRAQLTRHAARFSRPLPSLTDNQVFALEHHLWPGNLRELSNLAERATVMGTETLDSALTASPAAPSDTSALLGPTLGKGFELASYIEAIERDILVRALKQAGGDRRIAGELLGVERNTLRYKLRKYDLLDD